jgi:hypothetical protein
MTYYRLPTLDLSTRIQLSLEMLLPIPEGPWGRATELAIAYNVSRTLLYEMRDQAFQALALVLDSHKPGPKPQTNTLVIDQAFVQRAITIMPLLTGVARNEAISGIQQGLELLFDVHCSVGYIDQTQKIAGAAAEDYNAAIAVPLPVLAEADEIFHSGQIGFRLWMVVPSLCCTLSQPRHCIAGCGLISKCITACQSGSYPYCNSFGITGRFNGANGPAKARWNYRVSRTHRSSQK